MVFLSLVFVQIGFAQEEATFPDEVVVNSMVNEEDNAFNVKEILDNVPPVKQGFAWSLVENNLNYTALFEVIRKGRLSFNIGYAGAQPTTNHKAIFSLDWSIFDPGASQSRNTLIKNIVDAIDVEAGIWGGAGHLGADISSSETDWGITLTAVNFRFY